MSGDPQDRRSETERERIIARVYHNFTLGHMDWPHAERRPRVQPNVCWPCWNFAGYVEDELERRPPIVLDWLDTK
jgi:hypothetical protein